MASKLQLVPAKERDEDDAIQRAAVQSRYAMDTVSKKLLKETGRRATMRLFNMLGDEEKWEALGPRNQLAAIEVALTRAFGRVETVTADEKLTEGKDKDTGALPGHLRALAATLDLPELRGAKAATKVDGGDAGE